MSAILFESILHQNDIKFVPKDAVDVLGSARMSLILRL